MPASSSVASRFAKYGLYGDNERSQEMNGNSRRKKFVFFTSDDDEREGKRERNSRFSPTLFVYREGLKKCGVFFGA